MVASKRWGRVDNDFDSLLIQLASGAVDVDIPSPSQELVELAHRHGLIGALAQVTDAPLVKAINHRLVAREDVMKRRLAEVLEALNEAGIRSTLIKGPALADQYRDASVRHFSDIDLLVDPTHVEQAIEVLGQIDGVEDIPPKRPKADKRDVVITDDTGVRFNLDLHWSLFSYTQLRGAADGATSEAWDRAEFTEDESGPRWLIPESYVLAFLATHAVLDHRFRLILFRDFVEVADAGVDWAELAAVARRWNLRSTTYLALWMAKERVGAKVPDDFLQAIRPRSIAMTYLESSIPRIDLCRFDGRSVHPVNLAVVTLHDSLWARIILAMRAPVAFPGWRKKVASEALRRSP